MQDLKTNMKSTKILLLSLLVVSLINVNTIYANLAHVPSSTEAYTQLHPKPSSPLRIAIKSLSQPVAGQPAEFKVTTLSRIDVEDLAISVELPDGWEVISGHMRWQGALVQGQEQSLTFKIAIPSSGTGQFSIEARATMVDNSKEQFSAIDTYTIGSSASLKAISIQSARKLTRDGLNIIQYKLP